MADKWTYKDYQESQRVKDAYTAYQQQQANKPGAYSSAWQGQLNDMMNKIQNREKFSYDPNADALYQQYKNQYIQGGKLAMQDTMGQAASLTGGYGNSYASTAGNQAYQQYLTQLTDKIPELASMAFDRYQAEGQDLYNQYGLLQDRENTDYGRYRDTVADYNTALDRLYGIYTDERGFDYGQYGDNRTMSYQQYRDAIADQQAAAQLAEEQRQFNENMAWQREQAAAAAAAKASSGGSSSGKTGGTTKTHNMTTAEEKTLKEYIASRDFEAADNYINLLRTRGLSDDEASYWVGQIPGWYWEGGHNGTGTDLKKPGTTTSIPITGDSKRKKITGYVE